MTILRPSHRKQVREIRAELPAARLFFEENRELFNTLADIQSRINDYIENKGRKIYKTRDDLNIYLRDGEVVCECRINEIPLLVTPEEKQLIYSTLQKLDGDSWSGHTSIYTDEITVVFDRYERAALYFSSPAKEFVD